MKYCRLLLITVFLFVINGGTQGSPIGNKPCITNIFTNLFHSKDSEMFRKLETDINEKIKKGQYDEALELTKKMEDLAIREKSGYWINISLYYSGICAKYKRDYKSSLKFLLQVANDEKNPLLNEPDRLINLYRHTADAYKKTNDLDHAISYYKKGLELSDKVKDKKLVVPAYVNLGSSYSALSKFAEAQECYLKGLDLLKGSSDFMASVIYNNLGNDEYSRGDYSKAIDYYMNSIQISEKIDDLNGLALTYNNIANIYTKELADFKKAIEYYTKSLEIEKKRKNDEGIATELNNIGNVLTLQLQYKQAEQPFNEALHIFTSLKNPLGIARTFEYLGALHCNSGKYNKAIEDFTRCIDIRKKNNDETNLTDVYNNLGATYFYQKEYQKALPFYFKSLEISKSKKDKSMMRKTYSGLHDVFAGLGQYDKAYKYLKDYSDLKDTLLNATISRQIIDIQEKYEKSKIEQKVAVQNLEIKNKSLQRNGLLAFLALAIIIFSSLLYFIFQKRKNEKLLYLRNTQLKDKEIVNLVQQSEIKSMLSLAEGQENERQRISRELHDRVGSMLSLIKLNLSNYEEENKPFIKENLSLVDNTYQEVRNISHNLHSGLLTRFGLKAALKDLKNTVESHNTLRVNLSFHEEELALSKDMEVTVFKVLQELVTNALKHADAKNLDIQINGNDDGSISVSIEDDGKGFDIHLDQNEGIGLKNIRYRISSIGGELEINSSPGKGACFMIQIPVATSNNTNVAS